MSRRIFLQVTAPAVLIGVLLVTVCVASLWSIRQLQANLNSILAENVASLEAAGELEVKLRAPGRRHSVPGRDRRAESWGAGQVPTGVAASSSGSAAVTRNTSQSLYRDPAGGVFGIRWPCWKRDRDPRLGSPVSVPREHFSASTRSPAVSLTRTDFGGATGWAAHLEHGFLFPSPAVRWRTDQLCGSVPVREWRR
jgi:hypothetical protein